MTSPNWPTGHGERRMWAASIVLGYGAVSETDAARAIAYVERVSGLDPSIVRTLPDGSRNRGILQWNSAKFPEIDDAAALDVGCAFWWMNKKSNGFRSMPASVFPIPSDSASPNPGQSAHNAALSAVRWCKTGHGNKGKTYSTPPVVADGKPQPGTWTAGTIVTEVEITGRIAPSNADVVDAILDEVLPANPIDDIAEGLAAIVDTISNAFGGLSKLLGALFDPETYRRGALLVGGIVLAVIAIVLIIGDTKFGKNVAATAAKAEGLPVP